MGVAPSVALSSMQRHAIPGVDAAEALRLHHALHVIFSDDAGIASLLRDRQHFRAGRNGALGFLVGNGVQHDQTANKAEFAYMFDTQRTHAHYASTGSVFVGIPADGTVVEHRPFGGVYADM